MPLQTDVWGVIEDGSNIGKNGRLAEFEKRVGKNRSIAALETENKAIVRTSLEYIFVIGKDKPIIEIPVETEEEETAIDDKTGEASNDDEE